MFQPGMSFVIRTTREKRHRVYDQKLRYVLHLIILPFVRVIYRGMILMCYGITTSCGSENIVFILSNRLTKCAGFRVVGFVNSLVRV